MLESVYDLFVLLRGLSKKQVENNQMKKSIVFFNFSKDKTDHRQEGKKKVERNERH